MLCRRWIKRNFQTQAYANTSRLITTASDRLSYNGTHACSLIGTLFWLETS